MAPDTLFLLLFVLPPAVMSDSFINPVGESSLFVAPHLPPPAMIKLNCCSV